MAVAAGGPRLLLRRLREIMAEQTSAQTRLDKLVTVIATNMVAEVCSIYLRRAGKALDGPSGADIAMNEAQGAPDLGIVHRGHYPFHVRSLFHSDSHNFDKEDLGKPAYCCPDTRLVLDCSAHDQTQDIIQHLIA